MVARGAGDRAGTEQTASGTARPGALPNVIIIGAMKCGTTSLHNYLDAHPQISMSEGKELNFFYREDRWKEQGIAWYRRQFDPDVPVRGESSVNYTKNLRASRISSTRMREVIPDAKLIYIVRHPIERAVSHYLHTRAAGNEERTLSEALGDFNEQYVTRSLYYANLRPFLKQFPRENLLVVPQEGLLSRRSEVLWLIFSFLGVDPDVAAPEFSMMWETSTSKAAPSSEVTAKSPTATAVAGLDPTLRKSLNEHFRPDFKRMRRLMAPQFRPSWRLGPGEG
jgi:Sulfotransferase domain